MKRMTWMSLAMAVSVALVLAALLVGHASTAKAATSSNPFVGAWESTDTDGSHQTLAIGDGVRGSHVVLYDNGGSVCGPSFSPVEASGVGQVTGNDLTVNLASYCLQPRRFVGVFTVTYTYDPATNTLIDIFGVVWYQQV